jgi:hypothetical protein
MFCRSGFYTRRNLSGHYWVTLFTIACTSPGIVYSSAFIEMSISISSADSLVIGPILAN